MKILFAVSEAYPFIISGGLGEVAGALPKALANIGKENNDDIRVILPLYSNIPREFREKMKFVGDMKVPLSWRMQYSGIFYYLHDNVKFYFIDNEYYFKRERLYGEYDDGERYAFFCKAVIKAVEVMDFKPDVIHCNDWHTALIPVYLKSEYAENEKGIKTVFTIHNIQYQGVFDMEMIEDVFDIPGSGSGIVEHNGRVNLMKGGILSSDCVTTVSPSYAEEIQKTCHGYGLEDIVLANKSKLTGIVNGIDKDCYDPGNDLDIAEKYSSGSLEGKAVCKKMLQKKYGFDAEEDIPVVAIISRLVDHKGFELVTSAFGELMKRDVQFIVLGTGDMRIEKAFTELTARYPGRAAADIRFSTAAAKQIYAGADIFLMPSKSEPCGLAQMVALRYGTVPVVRDTGGLGDTVKEGAAGNGFKFKNYGSEDMLDALDRAIKEYSDKNKWRILVKRCMEWDFSWETSAESYRKLYDRLCRKKGKDI